MRLALALLTLVMLFSVPAMADADKGLYAPPVPEGAVVLRFLNASAAEVDVKAGGKAYGAAKAGETTAYYIVKEGAAMVDMGGKTNEQPLAKGKRYTAILKDDKATIVEDPAGDNRAKATVILYNLSAAPVTLKAKEGTAAVIENVAAMGNGFRELNGVKVDFSVHGADGASMAKIDPVILERSVTYGIVFDGTKADMTTATTDTLK